MQAISGLFVGAVGAIGGAAGATAGFIGKHAGTIASVGGSGLNIFSTLQGGKEAAEIGKRQQQEYEAEAHAELVAGGERAKLKREEGRRLTASQIAAISASGTGLVGSNLVVMAETVRNVEMDAHTLARNAGIRAWGLKRKGAWARYEGWIARRNARVRALTGGAGTAGKAYSQYKKWQGTGGRQTLGNIGQASFGMKQAGAARTAQLFTTGK